ncbi:MAG TPA: autotransporter domain-containing protein [Rickettsiales bacterium]|nr:autotransporter domain-containing protein [Rickettsiales bacterium]
MSQLKPLKKYLIGSTALIGGSFFLPATAFAISCPTIITGTALSGIVCDFDATSSVTVANGGNVGGINLSTNTPPSPGYIHNNGTLGWTGTGIVINSSNLSGGIANSGTISTDASGIGIINGSAVLNGITNTGNIISTAAGTGIRLSSSILMGGITNSGTISGSNNDEGIAIINNSTVVDGIHNTGVIQGGPNGNGILMRSSNLSGGIANSGTISGAGTGLAAFNVSNITGDIVNSGTITGTTSAGISLHNGATLNGSLINQAGGVISGGNAGILVFSATNITGHIANSGTISSANTGIRISSTAIISGGIQNSGTIQGNIFAINIDPTSTVPNIDLLSGSTVIGDIQATNTTLNLLGGQIDGNTNVNAINVASNFTTHGNLTANNTTVASGDRLTLRAGDTLTGNFAGNGGTLAFGVSNNTFGKIVGNADLTGVNVAVDLGNAPLLHNGDEMKVIQGSAPLTGGPGGMLTAISDNSYLWNFQMVDGTGATTPTSSSDLFIRASRASSGNLGFNPADTNTYNTLQTFADANTSDPAILRVLGNLNSAPTRAAAQNTLQSVEPTLNGSDFIGAQALNNQTLNMAAEQLAILHGSGETGMAAGGNLKGVRIWGQMFDAEANQGEHQGIKGYSANSWGGAVGIDTRNINDKTILGLALSSGQTNANSKNANHTGTDVNSYQLTLYGDYAFTKDTFASGMLAYGWQNVDTIRYDVGGAGGSAAHGDFNTNEIAARTELGKNYRYGSTLVTPSILANYLHYSPDSYTETGAGSMNLHIDRKNMDVLELGVGTKLSWTYQRAEGVLTPSVHGGWRYDVIGDHLDATNSFAAGGPAFDTQGIQPGRGTLDMGASVKYVTNSNIELTANYELQHKMDYTSNAGFVRAAYKF